MSALGLSTIAGAIALMIAVLTALKLISENFQHWSRAFQTWRDRWRKPKYVLLPTVEELAQYSVKTAVRIQMSPGEVLEERRATAEHAILTRGQIRIYSVLVLFASMYAAIGLRLLYLGIEGSFSP